MKYGIVGGRSPGRGRLVAKGIPTLGAAHAKAKKMSERTAHYFTVVNADGDDFGYYQHGELVSYTAERDTGRSSEAYYVIYGYKGETLSHKRYASLTEAHRVARGLRKQGYEIVRVDSARGVAQKLPKVSKHRRVSKTRRDVGWWH